MTPSPKWSRPKFSWPDHPFAVRCPKTGKIIALPYLGKHAHLLFPVVGMLALAWFLIRVIPKPSRIAYPCQRAALGLGGAFLAYAAMILGSFSLVQNLRRNITGSLIAAIIAVACFWGGWAAIISDTLHAAPAAVAAPPEGANHPMGTARGVHPGRVVWIQDFDATRWDGEQGLWWDDANTDPQIVEAMVSQALRRLTGADTDAGAWEALFRYHNQTRGRGARGYQKDETITIKFNFNTDGAPGEREAKKGHASTQVVYALVKQLIEEAGVPGANITLTDPSRHVGIPVYEKIRANPHPEYQHVVFAGKADRDVPQYIYAEPDMNCPVYFDMPDGTTQTYFFPKVFSQATYMINAGQFRPHSIFGLTLAGKNHFGSIFDGKGYQPSLLHAFDLLNRAHPNRHGMPHCHPSLLGHQATGGKTFLYLLDGLYTSHTQTEDIVRWSTLGNEWFSSLLLSQDPVAIDSVGYDFVMSEPNLTRDNPCFNGHVDSYLHEAALAGRPPSGAVYDPEKDGTKLASLGVHEHWNNAVAKQYSRNLAQGEGIELVAVTGKKVE